MASSNPDLEFALLAERTKRDELLSKALGRWMKVVPMREDDDDTFSMLASAQETVFLEHATSPPFIAIPPAI